MPAVAGVFVIAETLSAAIPIQAVEALLRRQTNDQNIYALKPNR